ncbi:hypothetical protein [Blastococcus litoris]|uniref:hypothetical protein n=1 Tax=Blastococcus litoris TaxID=2171622 RepID=UPI000E30093F|nr:hypothetical protein [Blastococcus litoris]
MGTPMRRPGSGRPKRRRSDRLQRWVRRATSSLPTESYLARRFPDDGRTLALVAVYRHKNAGHLARLLADAVPQVALWALDEVHPDLAHVTVGSGPGGRFELLGRCLDTLTLDESAWLVIADDDVRFSRGDLRSLARIAGAVGLDICQPAHEWNSHSSRRVNRSRPLMLARDTGFVEIGPIVLMDDRARRLALPLPTRTLMGWGVDVEWTTLQRQGIRLGVVDAVRVEHLGAVAADYGTAAERQALDDSLAAAGLTSIDEAIATTRRWTLTYPLRRRAVRPARW